MVGARFTPVNSTAGGAARSGEIQGVGIDFLKKSCRQEGGDKRIRIETVVVRMSSELSALAPRY